MGGTVTITRSSRLRAPASEVWAHATSMDGINAEMGPWMHMSVPRAARGMSLADANVTLGQPLFSSVILFMRLLPVDRMRVTLTELEPGRRFVEQSPMLTLRSWRHERTIEPTEDGCTLTDTLTLAPPVAALAPAARFLISKFFDHRHARLRAKFA